MKTVSSRFLGSAAGPGDCPEHAFPEFAFIGRSNVGKSSLLNLLAGSRDLARVSSMPGKTQLLNFFLFNNAFCLVDLPGYGYAKVAKETRLDFSKSVAAYLETREQLTHIFVLVDGRLPPQPIDLDFLRWLSRQGRPFSLVFTKMEKVKAKEADMRLGDYQRTLGAFLEREPRIFCTSSVEGSGRSSLLRHIAAAAEQE